jgi:basic amino acid/polyamine antiporter, APA family
VFIVLVISFLLTIGTRESTRVNAVMVGVKLLVLAFFVVVAFTAFNSSHFTPFAPNGASGVTVAAGVIFFAYIGFDAVSTGSEESNNPGRDLPIAIIGSLLISTVIYVLVAIAAVGVAPIETLTGSDAPLAAALREGAGLPWAGGILAAGALVAITTVVLVIMYGQTRIFFAMCRDGMFPRKLAHVHPRFGTPARLTIGFGILIAILAALIPLGEIVKLVNIGTLFAFLLVNIGVLVLRRTRPDMPRPFRVPWAPVLPIVGCLFVVYLMTQLPLTTWVRFIVWLIVGLIIYFAYSRRHSRIRLEGSAAGPNALDPDDNSEPR